MSPISIPGKVKLEYSSVAYDLDAALYLAAVEAADGQTLEGSVRKAITAFVIGCKADGIWDAIKASCILAGARTLSGALVPLKGTAPTNFNFVAGDYNRETGLVGNGSTKYLDSNRNNNADPQNNSHLCCFASSGTTASYLGASFGGVGDTFIIGAAASSWPFRHRILNFIPSEQGTRSVANAVNFIGMSRSSGSTLITRINGTNQSLASDATTALSGNHGVFARIQSGSMLNPGSARLSFYSIGESLDLALLDSRVTTLMNAIGAAIP